MRRFLTLAALLVIGFRPAAADTLLVLPFFNLSTSNNLDWIGESIADTVREAIASEGFVALERTDREEAMTRLGIRPVSVLTHASVIKIGEALDAGRIVYGDYNFTPAAATPNGSRGSLIITAHILNLKTLQEGPEFSETGALEDLAALQSHLAWQTLRNLAPESALSEQEFLRQHPPVRVDAVENYVRGLLAGAADQKMRFFVQASRLDSAYSQPRYQLGHLYFERKDYKNAAQWLSEVTPTDAHFRAASFLLGLCRYELGDWAAAQTAFQLVANTVPLNEVYNDLGAAQLHSNPADALISFRKALSGDPNDPVYQFNTGLAFWKENELSAAADRFRAVLKQDPEDGDARMMLDRCANHTGPREAAAKREVQPRLKTAYQESAYWQLKALLKGK